MSKADIEVAAAVNKLFRRLPALTGFSVQQVLEHELVLADVETDLWPARSQELLGEITVALLDLVDEEPEARHLLIGRTFARKLH